MKRYAESSERSKRGYAPYSSVSARRGKATRPVARGSTAGWTTPSLESWTGSAAAAEKISNEANEVTSPLLAYAACGASNAVLRDD